MRIIKAAAASPVTAQDKIDVQAALDGLTSNPRPTFDELRAALAAGKRTRFTDGMLAQTVREMGLTLGA